MDLNQISQQNSSPVADGMPYFLGNEALIRFSTGEEGYDQNTFWLVNKDDHTVRPFESHMALDAAFGDQLKEALQNAVTVSPPQTDKDGNITDGSLSGFTLLSPDYAIKEDGTSKPLQFSSHQLQGRYGKPVDQNVERLATEVLDGFLNLLKTNANKIDIPSTFIDKLKEDSQLMAYYVSALAYGKYTMEDIYMDVYSHYHDKAHVRTIHPSNQKSA